MGKAIYQKRKFKIFVDPRSGTGKLCSLYDNGSLTGRLENRFLFMLSPLAQMRLPTRISAFLSTYTKLQPLTVGAAVFLPIRII